MYLSGEYERLHTSIRVHHHSNAVHRRMLYATIKAVSTHSRKLREVPYVHCYIAKLIHKFTATENRISDAHLRK